MNRCRNSEAILPSFSILRWLEDLVDGVPFASTVTVVDAFAVPPAPSAVAV